MEANEPATVWNLSDWMPMIGVLAGGAITFSTQYLFFHFKSRADRKRSAALLAQDLDCFAYECSDAIGEIDNFELSGGNVGQPVTSLPSLLKLNGAADARDLKPELLSEFLSLELKTKVAQNHINFWGEVGHQDDMPLETKEYCANLGYSAFQLARKLRDDQSIPQPNYRLRNSSFDEVLLKTKRQLEHQQNTKGE